MTNFTTRRAFCASIAAAPAVLAADKSGLKLPVTGEGAHRYEVTHDWGELPKTIKYGNTHGVCVDAEGHVYIHHTVHSTSESDDTMVVFDRKGKFVRSWGSEFKGGAHGLTIHKEGKEEFLFLCDTKRALVGKYTLKGEKVWETGYPEQSAAYKPGADGKRIKYSPTNLAIAPHGDIYVGDGYGSSFVNVYSAKGEWKFTFGGKGKEAGQLDSPHGIAIDTRGKEPRVLVADRSNRRFQYFGLDGKHQAFGAQGDVKLPCHFDQYKGLLLVPDLEARVTLMDKDNKVLAQLCDDESNTWGKLRKEPREQFRAGKFVCPHSACFDKDGNIFVVEWVEVGRVTKLRRLA
jgi:sugar lactone lactonase YvrE